MSRAAGLSLIGGNMAIYFNNHRTNQQEQKQLMIFCITESVPNFFLNSL
jgi:hypothetical protein